MNELEVKKMPDGTIDMYVFEPVQKHMIGFGKVVGRTFHKRVKTENRMRTLGNSYGLQEVGFQKLVELGVVTIVLHEENGNKWESLLQDWLQRA